MKPAVPRLSGKAAASVVIVVLAFAVVALTIQVFMLRHDKDAQTETASRRAAPSIPAAGPVSAPRPAAPPVDGAAVADSPATNQTEAGRPADNPMAAIAAQMMNSPAMRDMMAAQQKKAMETQYAAFLDQFQFTPDQRTRFFAAMIEGQAGSIDLGMSFGLKMMSGDMSAADKEEMTRQMEESGNAAKAKMEAFFSSEFPADGSKLEAFRQYEDLLPDREQVDSMQVDFSKAGHPLTPDQSTALAALMNEERKRSGTSPESGATPESSGMDFAMSQESMDKAVQEEEQMQKKVADRAASVLGPEQMATLRASQASQLEEMKMGMQFSIQMMSSRVPAPAR